MKRIFATAIALLAAWGLAGCGGGGSSGGTEESTLRGVAQLGYIAGGKAELFALGDEKHPLASAFTSAKEGAYGTFAMEGVRLPADEYFVLRVTGGRDMDPDDDGVVSETETVRIDGAVHAVVSRRELLEGGVRVTALTDMAYRRIGGGDGKPDASRVRSVLDEEARSLLYDVDGDGRVDATDLQRFDPVLHRDRTRLPYAQILQHYVAPIEKGASKSEILASLLALRPPKIVVEGGAMREAPAKISVRMEGLPAGVSVRWSLDGEAKERIDETLRTPGTREIVAELFADGELLGRRSGVVTVVESRTLEAAEATPQKRTLLAVASSPEGGALAGTTVAVPAGAVTEPVRVSGSRAEGGAIPHEADRIPVTEVLRLEPAGQTFQKPVRVTLPYDPQIVSDPSLIEVVRYSDGGGADVIAPLFVDEQSAEIVFETDHFTYFQGKTTFSVTDLNKYVPGRKTGDEKFVDALNREFPEYSRPISEWKEILNTPLRDDGKVTVYDYLRDYLATKRMYGIVKNGDPNEKFYSRALRALFPDILDATRDLQLWNDIKEGFDAMNLVSGAGSATLKISDGEVYKALLEQLGVPTASSEMQIYDPVSVGGKIVESVTDSAVNDHLRRYFEHRDGFYRASSGRFDYEDLGATLDTELAYFRRQNILWAAESMVRRYEAFDPQKELTRARETIAAAIGYAKRQKERLEAADEKRALFVQNGVNVVYYEPGETVKIPYEMKLYGYDASPLLAMEVLDAEGRVLVGRSESKGSLCSIVEKGVLESVCRGEYELDTAKSGGARLVKLKAYREGHLLPDEDLRSETFVHLRKAVHLAVEEVETAIGYDRESDEVRVDVTVGFSGGIDAPCSVDLYDETGRRKVGVRVAEGRFVLDRETALGFGMDRVRVRVAPMSEKYRFDANEAVIDLKSRVEKVLKAAEGESTEEEDAEGTDATMEVACLPALVPVGGTEQVRVGESVRWRLETAACPVSSILSVTRGCEISTGGSLECRWSAAGIFRPYVKVLLPDGRVERISATKRVTVSAPADNGNRPPIVEEQRIVTEEGTPREFRLAFFDPDGDEGVTIEAVTRPLHGKLEALGGDAFRYTPAKGFAGEDAFLFRAHDAEAYSQTVRARIVVEAQVRPRSLRYRGETEPGDDAWVESGTTFEKSWSFLNPDGNRDLEGVGAVLVANGCGFGIVPESRPPSAVRSGGSFTVGYRFRVPDAADGSCEVLFELRDREGALLYENGARARFFLRVRVHGPLPSGVRLLPVDGGVAGSLFLFRAQTAEPLPEGYTLALSLGDGGGGWLNPVPMIASPDAQSFSLAQRVSRPGSRGYRVAIFRDGEPLSEWTEGSYRVYDASEKVAELTVTQTDEGALLAWSPAEGASAYRPMYSLSFGEEGPYAEMTGGCDFRSATSCLVPASRFAERKRWYFRVEPDKGLASDAVAFVWRDASDGESGVDDDPYRRYLAGRTLYREDGYVVRFDADLTKMTMLRGEGDTGESTIERTDNGLRVGGLQSSEYLVIVEADDTRVLIENAELTEGGVYISHNGTLAYYFDNPAGAPDLEGALVDNALYLHCDFGDSRAVGKFFFASDGRLLISWDGNDTQQQERYRISGDLLETYDEEGSDLLKAVEIADDFIRFEEEGDDIMTLFFSYDRAAASAPVDCGGDRRIEVSGLVSGRVIFYDENNDTVAVPADAWVGITPESQKRDWNRMTCPVDATGHFGDRCYIEEDEEGVRRAFADASETYQLVVFKNHVEPENFHWNCGEDLYRFVGESVPRGEWERIEVRPSDYESRAGEACDGMAEEHASSGGPVAYDGFEGDFMNSSYCRAEEGDRVLGGVGGTVEGWHGESYPLQLLVVLDGRESRVKCFMYDFHHYYDGEMGGGQNGTDQNEPQRSVLEADRLRLEGSYDFVFDGTLSESGLYEGTWRQSASEINGEYDGSGSFRIELSELNVTAGADDPEGPDPTGSYLSRALIAPNGGESWKNGEERELRWDAGAFSGERLEAYVLHDDPAALLEALQSGEESRIRDAVRSARWYRFAANLSDGGSVRIDPAIMGGNGNAYMVLLVSDRGEWDVSDGTFSLGGE